MQTSNEFQELDEKYAALNAARVSKKETSRRRPGKQIDAGGLMDPRGMKPTLG